MTDKKTDKQKTSNSSLPAGQSITNPQAASRRRLLRALGTAGGTVALGALTSPNWVKPVVRSVALPAHASTTQPQCSVVLIVESSPFTGVTSSCLGSIAYSIGAYLSSAAETVEDYIGGGADCKTVSVSTTCAPGSVALEYNLWKVSGDMYISSTILCGTESASGFDYINPTISSTSVSASVTIAADGSCTIT